MRIFAGLFLLVSSPFLFAQGDSWDAKDSSDLSLTVPGGRDKASTVTKMSAEKRCPPGDSWVKPLPDQDWNTVEFGFSISTPLQVAADTEPKLYSRYTCQRPIDKP